MAFPFPFAFWQQSAVAEWNYGFFAGGKTSGGVNQNIIDYIDVTSTTGNATDKGDLSVTRTGGGACASSSNIFFGGGWAV